MADLAAVDRIRVVEDRGSDTLPAGEAIGPGVPCRQDTSSGKAMIGNATVAGEAAVIGLNTSPKATLVNSACHILRRGKVALYDSSDANILAGLDFGALVYLSDTDGRLADANGTVTKIIGRVIALWHQTTPEKILDLDLVE